MNYSKELYYCVEEEHEEHLLFRVNSLGSCLEEYSRIADYGWNISSVKQGVIDDTLVTYIYVE